MRGSVAVQPNDYICNRKKTDGSPAMVRNMIAVMVTATLCALALQACGAA